MRYVTIFLNHLRDLQQSVGEAGVTAVLDFEHLQIELKGHGLYHTLHPQFSSIHGGKMGYSEEVSEHTVGFIGWRPYRPVGWTELADKLAFKSFVRANGFRVPKLLEEPYRESAAYVLKKTLGSFGTDVRGPFRPGPDRRAPMHQAEPDPKRGIVFAEEFIVGSSAKVWFWGSEPVFAHLQASPTIRGDGVNPVRSLLAARLSRAGIRYSGQQDQASIRSCLAYHGVSEDSVLPPDQELWFDYRYGRQYGLLTASNTSDNAWSDLPEAVRDQSCRIGQLIGNMLAATYGGPILCAIDAVVDTHQDVWWLEANTNPIVPPDVYRSMITSLFRLPQWGPSLERDKAGGVSLPLQ